MLTKQDIAKASKLIERRERVQNAKWNVVARFETPSYMHGFGSKQEINSTNTEPFDDEIAFAVEEFRGRLLATIDAQLRELGVDPAQEVRAD